MTRLRAARLALGAALVAAGAANAHPLSPALLDVRESAPGILEFRFKTPLRGGVPGLHPSLPESCRPLGPASRTTEGTGAVWSWRVDCQTAGVEGLSLGVGGLRDGASALLRVEGLDGERPARLLTEGASRAVTGPPSRAAGVAADFLAHGVQHLLAGADHVLFIVLVTWIVGWGRRLFWTVTAFTGGHSLTLAAAVLGWVQLPTVLVEGLIALSVVAAAAELCRTRGRGLFGRAPVAAAAAFGLLHGMGFAGALSASGVPPEQLPWALFAFNVGIELGQLALVLPAAAAAAVGAAWARALPTPARALPGYAVGTLAAFWLWQQLGVPGGG